MKQTLVSKNGISYTQEIKGRDIKAILDRISVQTSEHILSDDDIYIYEDERIQLNQLMSDIGFGVITEDNFDDYLSLWEPEVLKAESGSRVSVSLTVYDDGTSMFKCFIPGSYFEIYEY